MERNEIIAILVALAIAAWRARKKLIKKQKPPDMQKQSEQNYWI